MAKENEDETSKVDESHPPEATNHDGSGSKKRKDRDDDANGAENNAEADAKKQKSDKDVTHEEAKVEAEEKEAADDSADKPSNEKPTSEDKPDADDKPSEDGANAPAPNEPQQQQATAVAAALGNPLLAAGMPLAAVPGFDPSSPQANLHPFLLAQQGQIPFGAAGFPIANAAAFQGLVANRPGANAQQPGQAAGQEQNAAAAAAPGGQSAPLPAPAFNQLYAQQGFDPAQMGMMMGFPPGFAGNPFMGAMRPFMGGIGEAPLASFAAGLYRSPSIPLALPCDEEHLSEYQILVRQQLELFEAEQEDVDSNTQGRKKAVTLGQVGLRCRHCAGLPLRQRGKGSVYYPNKLTGIYQAAQNMAASHLVDACQCIDERLKVTLMGLRQRRDTASGGKVYWADGAKAIGLYETEDGLRISRPAQQPQQPLSG